MAIVVKGDALKKEEIQKAFDTIEEVDAVVSSIGGTPADPSADSQVSLQPIFEKALDATIYTCLTKCIVVTHSQERACFG